MHTSKDISPLVINYFGEHHLFSLIPNILHID
jgi:hypothetical protein